MFYFVTQKLKKKKNTYAPYNEYKMFTCQTTISKFFAQSSNYNILRWKMRAV